MLTYAITIFTGAFLLFQVEPLLARYILPWFGGTSAVWITCMLFFQLLLVAGYAYSHLVVTRLRARRQAIVHVAIVSACVLLMAMLAWIWQSPITPGPSWKPLNPDFPVAKIFIALNSQHRTSLFRVIHHRTAATGMVRAFARGRIALSTLRAIQCRLLARTCDLSVRSGTGANSQSAGDRMVSAIHRIRGRPRPMRAQRQPRFNCPRLVSLMPLKLETSTFRFPLARLECCG